MRASGDQGWPPRSTGVVSPIRRLNSRATRSASVAARRSAASPTLAERSARTCTTVGMAAVRPPRDTTWGSEPARTMAAAVHVVPMSTPSA